MCEGIGLSRLTSAATAGSFQTCEDGKRSVMLPRCDQKTAAGWCWPCSSAPAPRHWSMKWYGPSFWRKCSAARSTRRRWCWRCSWAAWHWATGFLVAGQMACRNQSKAYGVLEILIGIYAFLFPSLDRLTNHVFILTGTPIAEHAGWLLALKGVLSAVLLLGPTILMGGTLPLLAAWLHQFSTDAGRRSARFYSVNSLGAVTGAALAGFWLVQHYGMIATIQITATANILIGASAVLLNWSGWLPRLNAVAQTSEISLTTRNHPSRQARCAGPA